MGGGGSIRKPGDLLSEWERRRPDIREKRGTASMRSPAPTRPGCGRRGKWGTKDAHGPQLRSPSRPEGAAARDPAPETGPEKTPPQPRRAGRAEAAGPPALGDARGEAASHTWSSALSGPSPAPSGASRPAVADGRLVPGQSPRRPAAAKGLGRGGGGGEGRGNSRSSWQRPCRRSAPPAPPAGLSAPVARGPPSSRAGSGRTRMIRDGLEGSEGGCDAAGARVLEGPTHTRRERLEATGAEAATRAATAGPGARRLRRLCVRRADNPLRPRPRRVTQTAPPTSPREAPAPAPPRPLPLLGFPLPGSARYRLPGIPFFPGAPRQAPCFTSSGSLRPSFSRRSPTHPGPADPNPARPPTRGPLGVVVLPGMG